MTNKEALEKVKSNYVTTKSIELKEALFLAMFALEKQEVKPPVKIVPDDPPVISLLIYCACGAQFPNWPNGTNYCGNCGQKLREVAE